MEFVGDLNGAGVACADADGVPRSRQGRPQRIPDADRPDLGNDRAASANRRAQAQRYASSLLPPSRSTVLAIAGTVVAGLAQWLGDRPVSDGLALAPERLVGAVAISLM